MNEKSIKQALEQAIELLASKGADNQLLDLLYILRRNDVKFTRIVAAFARGLEK